MLFSLPALVALALIDWGSSPGMQSTRNIWALNCRGADLPDRVEWRLQCTCTASEQQKRLSTRSKLASTFLHILAIMKSSYEQISLGHPFSGAMESTKTGMLAA